MKRLSSSRHGFTLLELIGVIAILAILVAILLPVFTQSTCGGRNRQSGCSSNAKQIGTAFMMYAQDYNETLPPACTYLGALLPLATASAQPIASPRVAWTNLAGTGPIDGYLKNQNVKECPSGSGDSPRLDYAMNWYIGQRTSRSIESPSDCILILDAASNCCAVSSDSPATSAAVARHGGQTIITCAFVDGHVKSFKLYKVWPITLYVPAKNLGTGNMWAPNGRGASGKEFPIVPR